MSEIGICTLLHLLPNSTVEQSDLVDGCQSCTTDARDIAQVNDQVAGRIHVQFLCLIGDLNKIRSIYITLQTHNGDRFLALVIGYINFHGFLRTPILTEIEFFVMKVDSRNAAGKKLCLECLYHWQRAAHVDVMIEEIPMGISQDFLDR